MNKRDLKRDRDYWRRSYESASADRERAWDTVNAQGREMVDLRDRLRDASNALNEERNLLAEARRVLGLDVTTPLGAYEPPPSRWLTRVPYPSHHYHFDVDAISLLDARAKVTRGEGRVRRT